MQIVKSKALWAAIVHVCFASTLIAQVPSAAALASRSGVITLRVRDSATGYGVQASVSLRASDSGANPSINTQTDSLGHLRVEVPQGRYILRVTSPGFKPMELSWDTGGPVNHVMLDVIAPPQELRPEVLDAQLRAGYVLVHGYVADADTGKPLRNVRMRLDRFGMDTSTNGRGYFSQSLQMPVLPPDAPGFEDDLSAELPGYKKYILANTLFSGPEILFQLELKPGSGVDRRDNTHKLLRGTDHR
jgi:hypothetical protein